MKMLKLTKITAFILTALSLSSCLKDDNTNDIAVAGLTTINAFTGANAIFHIADNNNIQSPYSPLQYSNTHYVNLFPGNRRIRVMTPDAQSPLVDTTLMFRDSTFYTSITFGTTTKPEFMVVPDLGIEDLGEKASIRFFHVANGVARVNVYLNDEETPIFPGRNQENKIQTANIGSSAKFIATNAGTQKIIVKDLNGTIIQEKEFKFDAKKYYSIILMGESENAEKPLKIGIAQQY